MASTAPLALERAARRGAGASAHNADLIRVLDVAIALIALAFLAPLLLMIALLVALTSPGPVIFAQRRIGLGGQSFYCLKFRSMAIDAEARLKALLAHDSAARAEWARDHKLRDDPRVTRLGQLLRKTSLDELPQLLNVLMGEMSIVGPRPIVSAECQRYGRYLADYCRVKPGLTGLWQISGRSNLDYRRRVALDVLFSRHISTPLYLRILVMTVPAVLATRGAY